jgi:eukaryotic-like serine/threonine-protein kinase
VDPRVERDASDPLVGRLLDRRYRIGPRIARGGMASVYEATDIRLDRVVAVKVMHPGLGDDVEFAARFVREARAAARLSHPNVVAVFDQGDEHGTVFLAMEYVPGHTLRDVIRKEAPMAPSKALALLDPVLSALGAAHRANLIHRDIKPENVLIADDGRVKVADFGLAKAVNSETQHTATGGVLIGTVSYLAPELVVDGNADARADVYAAGVVLYELLIGRKPHEGDSPIQVAYKHVHEDIPAPSAAVPGIPAYVDALVARATARDRSHRPADARVLLHQVHRVKQALDEGVLEDPELYADLAPPRPVSGDTDQFPELDEQPWTGPAADDDTSLIDLRAGSGAAVTEHDPSRVRPPAPPVPPQRQDPRPPAADGGEGRPRRRGRLILASLLTALVLLAIPLVKHFVFDYTTTPGVLGLSESAAQAKIEKAGLTFEVGSEAYSETVPAGMVISTDPGPGERVVEDGTVKAVISLGLERYQVPQVRNLSEDAAQAAILDANLDFGRSIPRYHPTIPEGYAIASNPKFDRPLKKGATVDIYLSRGPRPIKLTDFTGKDGDRAEQWLSDKGLKVERKDEYSDDVPEGRVISQDPSTGTAFKGDSVELVVSKGPELIEVPRVVAMGAEAAIRRLEDLGFEVETREADGYLGLGYVFSSNPSAGERAPKGSTIVLSLI